MNRLTLARRIKALRLEGKLTLQDIATHTGFTKSYLSLIESGKKAPPIATLSKIAHALGVEIAAFFEEENSKDRITIMRENERNDFVRQGVSFGYRYQSIAPIKAQKRIEAFVVLHPSGTEKEGWFDHEGEELLYVLEGKLKLFYGEEEYLLSKGDSAYFDSSIPHRGLTMGNKPVRCLIVLSQPSSASNSPSRPSRSKKA